MRATSMRSRQRWGQTGDNMSKYTDANGTEFTDEDIERWAAEVESVEGYTGGQLGPSRQGRPVSSVN